MLEIKPIPNLPLYGASPNGDIWSKKTKGPGRNNEALEWHRIKPKLERNGYLRVCLQRDDKESTYLVHRLIALTFLNLQPGQQVNHISGDKKNNDLSNLECVTYLENLKHAWDNNLIKIGKPKLTKEQVNDIRKLSAEGLSQVAISRIYQVGQSAISDIINYRTWK